MEKTTCRFPWTRYGYTSQLTVDPPGPRGHSSATSSAPHQTNGCCTVTFEDETSRIAADYEVMSVTNSPELTKREIDGEHVAPAVLAAEGAQHFFVEHGSVDNPVPRPQMQMKPAKCFLPSLALILAPSVMDPQEAFLLRHFRQILGPWVRTPRVSCVDWPEAALTET